jgi:hypothetical protein
MSYPQPYCLRTPALEALAGPNDRRACGVAIANQRMALATVSRNAGFTRLCFAATGHFVLRDRTQESLRRLQDELWRFLSVNQIGRITLRGAPPSGKQVGGGLGFKMEALLQLMPTVDLEIVHPATVLAWERRHRSTAPKLILGLRQTDSALQELAIATACCGLQRELQGGSSSE